MGTRARQVLQAKVVDLDDDPREDILSHLHSCCDYIDEARDAGGVLVYCTAGKSFRF